MIAYLAFLLLFFICLLVLYMSRQPDASRTLSTNPNFLQFQNGYLVVYLIATFADWLQSPYQYKLYSHYGFEEDQIAVLYVCGFASTVLLGSWAPVVADRFGRKKLCVVFTVIYSISSLIKLSSSYFVLLIGRVLGGVATSLLFSAFESWYLHEHIETHDFPKEWIQETFRRVDTWNGLLAILAGLMANALAEWIGLGPVSPFVLAVPFLLAVGVLISMRWPENRNPAPIKIRKSCMDGLREIRKDAKIFLAGIVQSLFESTMYIFVFIWTPVLDDSHIPLGVVFACFMAATVTGAVTFDLLLAREFPATILLASSVMLAALGNIVGAMATNPDDPRRWVAFVGLIVVEFSVGLYFRSMAVVRARLVPQATRDAINSWFRVPLNLIACAVLMCLHNDAFRHGSRLIFVSCTALLVLASFCVAGLVAMVRQDDDLNVLTTSATDVMSTSVALAKEDRGNSVTL